MNSLGDTGITDSEDIPDIFEISIWLDSYNDIFSDFDSRPLSERTVSDDFLTEVRKVCDEKSRNKIHLKLSIPENQRNTDDEKVIINRLHLYFRNTHHLIKQNLRRKNIRGFYYILAGTLLMLGASYISFQKPQKFYIHTLLILFEPAGWFFLWTGLEHLIYSSKSKKADLIYFNKMAEAVIRFVNLT
ncbi:MAG: hypothetical protein IPP60_11350 [Sphingobacteriales bacterium]|nr:hypothetical protein [Sphingobacteriales bacterium]